MFDNLSDKLDKAFHILKGHGKITEVNVAETLKEIIKKMLGKGKSIEEVAELTEVSKQEIEKIAKELKYS